ncbi:MAG: mercuric reductase [Gemmatimonadaceae bacterium]
MHDNLGDSAPVTVPPTRPSDRLVATSPLQSDADRKRLANVHPADWQNPSPAGRYHLVVIGAGTAGLVSAAIAAGLGARVALVERALMGGDCLNVGCVPSKALIRTARAWHEARTAAARFGGPAATGSGDFDTAMAHMRHIRAALSSVDAASRFRDLGVDVYFGSARFTDVASVRVRGDDQRETPLQFRRAIVATGGRASAPPIDGLTETGYLTNETVFDLDELPPRLLVIGGGPIGCELAQAFARLGSQVTILNAGSRLLAREDADASSIIERALVADGVELRQNVEILAARRDSDGCTLTYEVDGRRVECRGDRILVAAGRAANVEDLGLERAGVRFSDKGIDVNDRFRTSNHRIFAIGDCASTYQFTHAADAQARLAVPNALFHGIGGGKASSLVMPWCTYTSPEVAHVGLSASEVAESGGAVETITVPLAHVDRAVLDRDTEGFFRVHLARGSDRILGATLVSAHAGETISEITAAMSNGIGLSGLGKTIHPYPTQAEAIRKAADAYRRQRLTPRAKGLFDLYFRMWR